MPKAITPKKENSIKKSLKLTSLVNAKIGYKNAEMMFRFIKKFKRKTRSLDEEEMRRLKDDITCGDDFRLCTATEKMREMLTLIGKEKKCYEALRKLDEERDIGMFGRVIKSLFNEEKIVIQSDIAQGVLPEDFGSQNQIILSDYLVKALIEKQKQGYEMMPRLPSEEIESIVLVRYKKEHYTPIIKIYVN
jgi:hypothetical protein